YFCVATAAVHLSAGRPGLRPALQRGPAQRLQPLCAGVCVAQQPPRTGATARGHRTGCTQPGLLPGRAGQSAPGYGAGGRGSPGVSNGAGVHAPSHGDRRAQPEAGQWQVRAARDALRANRYQRKGADSGACRWH
ncbi:hypothetical protein HaLaN_28277, partial [Haematococcus lacustris]